ncbi:hypothetical protein CMI39_00725 [Candidatus Pacearchaeota archaeon]|jgi:hypothetical protein|nr:hypothetical protein [Candidatus Pacearchaeota archaeon]|tara:strand:- start:711 stop:896 length:186 start_codon:yes stop_codon:yes gene_type:complete
MKEIEDKMKLINKGINIKIITEDRCSKLEGCKVAFEKEIGIKYSGKCPDNIKECKYNQNAK